MAGFARLGFALQHLFMFFGVFVLFGGMFKRLLRDDPPDKRLLSDDPPVHHERCHGLGGCDNAWKPSRAFYPPSLQHTYVPAQPIELVVARYREDLTWLRFMPFPVTVYEHEVCAHERPAPWESVHTLGRNAGSAT